MHAFIIIFLIISSDGKSNPSPTLRDSLGIWCCCSGTIIQVVCGVRLRSRGFQWSFEARIGFVVGFGVVGLGAGVILLFYVGFKAISSGLPLPMCSLWPIYRLPS